jgi:hypothetical protein
MSNPADYRDNAAKARTKVRNAQSIENPTCTVVSNGLPFHSEEE